MKRKNKLENNINKKIIINKQNKNNFVNLKKNKIKVKK